MILLKVSIFWMFCFYFAVLLVSFLKGNKLNGQALKSSFFCIFVFLRANERFLKEINSKNKVKTGLLMFFNLFPLFVNMYLDDKSLWAKGLDRKKKDLAYENLYNNYANTIKNREE